MAYVILSHRDWPQVAHQIRGIRQLDPSAVLVVSHDCRDVEGSRRLSELSGVIVQTHVGGRADFSAIERWAAAVRAVGDVGGADFVLLLSGQDHMVAHPDRIKSSLASSGDGRMEFFEVDDAAQVPWGVREGFSRYRFAWRSVVPLSSGTARRLHALHAFNRLQPWWRVNVAYGALRVGRHVGPPPTPIRRVYGGSQWHALSWRAATRVVEMMTDRPDIVEWGRRSLVSDESFIQTIVLNDPELDVSQGSERFFDFSGTHFGHPKTLLLPDLEAITASDAWFARKLDWSESRELIDALDDRIGVERADRSG